MLSADDDRYTNHSETPNVLENPSSGDSEKPTLASRDIRRGEELTQNYREFMADFAEYADRNGIPTTKEKEYATR